MKQTTRFIIGFLLMLACMSFLTWPALALDLQAARDQGLVAEKSDGYVAAVKNTSEVSALVKSINARRAEEYARISKENGQPVNVVSKVAAETIIKGLKPGNLYEGTGGGWKKR